MQLKVQDQQLQILLKVVTDELLLIHPQQQALFKQTRLIFLKDNDLTSYLQIIEVLKKPHENYMKLIQSLLIMGPTLTGLLVVKIMIAYAIHVS